MRRRVRMISWRREGKLDEDQANGWLLRSESLFRVFGLARKCSTI